MIVVEQFDPCHNFRKEFNKSIHVVENLKWLHMFASSSNADKLIPSKSSTPISPRSRRGVDARECVPVLLGVENIDLLLDIDDLYFSVSAEI